MTQERVTLGDGSVENDLMCPGAGATVLLLPSPAKPSSSGAGALCSPNFLHTPVACLVPALARRWEGSRPCVRATAGSQGPRPGRLCRQTTVGCLTGPWEAGQRSGRGQLQGEEGGGWLDGGGRGVFSA